MNVLFIHGGGENGYEVDAKLASTLLQELGEAYNVYYPQMQIDENLPDFGWLAQITKEISLIKDEVILAGHSLGASMLLKFLSENKIKNKITGIFLISTPFWRGDEDWVQGLKLKEGFVKKLPNNVPIFLYHCRDDEEIPFEHLIFYKQKLLHVHFREIAEGGHQLNNDLAIVAQDIKSL